MAHGANMVTYIERMRFFGRSLEIPYYDDRFCFLIFVFPFSSLGADIPKIEDYCDGFRSQERWNRDICALYDLMMRYTTRKES